MRYVIYSISLFIIFSCAKHSKKLVLKTIEPRVNRLELDAEPDKIKLSLGKIICNLSDCDSLLNCYRDYFKYLYSNVSYDTQNNVILCALQRAENNDIGAHQLVMAFYGSPYTEKDGGTFDWSNRLRGEDAFEVTLEYMRQSKGDPGEDVALGYAGTIFYKVIIPMIAFNDGTNPYQFMVRESYKYKKTITQTEQENWLTTDFIDILKKEIKEGRVVFRKYGE